MTEIFKSYEKLFTELFTELYEKTGGNVTGISCEKVGPNVVGPEGGKLFVSFKVW